MPRSVNHRRGSASLAAVMGLAAFVCVAAATMSVLERSAERIAVLVELVVVVILLFVLQGVRRARDSRDLALKVAAKAEREARRSRDLLQAVIESLADTVVTARDSEGRYTTANRASQSVTGLPPDELLGRTLTETFGPERARSMEEVSARVRETGEPLTMEETLLRDGEERTFLVTRSPLREDGSVVGTVAVSMDITERKRAEMALRRSQEELRGAKEAAEAATRSKSEFLANMSHEIRTPMNTIIGMTELVLDTDLAPEQRQYLEMVRASAESLLEIIDEILDFSRIEAGHLSIDAEPFDVYQLLSQPLKALSLRAQNKDVELALRIHPSVPRRVVADPGRLRQVLVNLVGNAIKFTPRGEVVVEVETRPGPGGLELCVAVRDTGIGIPPDRQVVVFDPFSQSDASTTRRFGGTGLGLTISTRILEALGGHIELESTVGVGSTFRFATPVAPGTAAAESAPAFPPGLRVLVVDDNATSRSILADILAGFDVSCETAGDAADALRRLRAARVGGCPFDLVLLDSRLGGADGFNVARRIRRDPELAGTEVVMLLAGPERGERLRSRKLGIRRTLVKPVTRMDLTGLLALGGETGPHGHAPRPAPPAAEVRPLRILLAEDNRFNQRLAVGLLERLGHSTTVVENGRAAVEASARERFDLLLMDVQMPEMDGIEATRLIREREAGGAGHLPIVALTAHAMPADREWCLRSGMDGYIAKPLRSGHLREEIARVLELAGAAPAPAPALERDQLLRLTDGNAELLQELVELFLQDAPPLLESARAAAAAADREAVAVAAHRLKGSCAFFGPVPAAAAAGRLERLCRDGGAPPIDGAVDELAAALGDLLRGLRAAVAQPV